MLARCARGVAASSSSGLTRGFTTGSGNSGNAPGWNRPLREQDPELYQLVRREQDRQLKGLEMIASENFTSRAVMECLGSCLTNKYAEGEVGARYYGGNEVIDLVEQLAKDRALAAFGLDAAEWGCNVQPYSGSPANLAVYTGLLSPHDRLMGMALPSGGHLTHGHYTPAKKISAVSIFFESLPYKVREDGWIDYDELRRKALEYRPKLIICGGSAYPRVLDFPKFAAIADEVGAYLMADIAHISGLVAAGQHPSPFPYCDVVTTTTHKSLRGPRSGIVFARRRPRREGGEPNLIDKINFACFPGLQGGPHEHQIAGVAAQLKEVATPEFREYARQVISNSKALAEALTQKGHKLATGGTDNHLMLWDVRPFDLTGSKVEKLLDHAAITVNKNSIAGDKSAAAPGAVRLGTCALTTRGMREDEFRYIAGLLDRSLRVAVEIQAKVGKKLKDFEAATHSHSELQVIRKEVEEFASKFPMPGREI